VRIRPACTASVSVHGASGWGSVTHWNGFVANPDMQGQGTLFDPRLNDSLEFPIATRVGPRDARLPAMVSASRTASG